MGVTLTGLKIKNTYQGLIKTTDNLPFVSGVLRRLSDGFGNETDLQLGTDKTVSSNMEVTDNLDFLATIAEIDAGANSMVVTKEYFISKESAILDDLLSLKETPSGLVLFDLKGSELWLSVDGIMPTKVDLSGISEIKTIKTTLTSSEILASTFSNTKTIIPQATAGKAIRPIRGTIIYNYGTTPYSQLVVDDGFELKLGSSTGLEYGNFDMTRSFSYNRLYTGESDSFDDLVIGSGIEIWVDTVNALTGGDGTITAYFSYEILDLT